MTRELGFIRKQRRSQGCSNDTNNNTGTYDSCNCHVSFPQVNNMVFTFGRDVNIRYMHGIDAPRIVARREGEGSCSNSNSGSSGSSCRSTTTTATTHPTTTTAQERDEEATTQPPNTPPNTPPIPTGRISIIIWGWAEHVLEEPGSPPLLV